MMQEFSQPPRHSRRSVVSGATILLIQNLTGWVARAAAAPADKFGTLSANGNSSCSGAFQESIAGLPPGARLQGSCCSPMERAGYNNQVEGLKKYVGIPDVPPDPYDIDVSLAKKLMSYYDLKLLPGEQAAYDFAMANSAEKGPCCCGCWRWKVYGGLANLLIREHGFDGAKVTDVWNLSDGCGGG